MTSREGGPQVPDGVPRPASLPFVGGPNRSDMSALPGTPGTPLPPSPAEPSIQFGQGRSLRQQLQSIPLSSGIGAPNAQLRRPSDRPGEPITAGVDVGPGPGSGGLIPSPNDMSQQKAVAESLYMYPIIARLAALPNASTQTKVLAQRMRSMLPVPAERMPNLGG